MRNISLKLIFAIRIIEYEYEKNEYKIVFRIYYD